jgi:regulator of sigma E protease
MATGCRLIGEVAEGSPAQQAGLIGGDRINRINDAEIRGWQDIARLIPELAMADDGSVNELELTIERDGRLLNVRLTPNLQQGRPVIGIQAPPPGPELQAEFERTFTVMRHGPRSHWVRRPARPGD